MAFRPANLLGWGRPIGPATYFLSGLALFGVKYALDYGVAYSFVWWSPLHYVMPSLLRVTLGPPDDQVFFGTMLLVAIPFLAIGLALTLPAGRRGVAGLALGPVLRAVRQPLVLRRPWPDPRGRRQSWRAPSVPHGRRPRDLARARAIPGSVPGEGDAREFRGGDLPAPGDGPGAHGPRHVRPAHYGWSLFFGIPFGLGVASSVILGVRRPAGVGACLGVGQLALLTYGGLLLLVAIEGFICIVMAWPLAAVATFFGSPWGGPSSPGPGARRRRSGPCGGCC